MVNECSFCPHNLGVRLEYEKIVKCEHFKGYSVTLMQSTRHGAFYAQTWSEQFDDWMMRDVTLSAEMFLGANVLTAEQQLQLYDALVAEMRAL